jgi:hypothetical protein
MPLVPANWLLQKVGSSLISSARAACAVEPSCVEKVSSKLRDEACRKSLMPMESGRLRGACMQDREGDANKVLNTVTPPPHTCPLRTAA